MRNGSGDEHFIHFNSHGAIMKGFAHESSMSPWATDTGQLWPGVLDDVPSEFHDFLTEPASSIVWRRSDLSRPSPSYCNSGSFDVLFSNSDAASSDGGSM